MAPLETIYTADEAAERLRLTNRGVIKLARQYGLCSRRGRDYLFSESDLVALWAVQRVPAKEARSISLRPVLSGARLAASLLELTKKRKRSTHD